MKTKLKPVLVWAKTRLSEKTTKLSLIGLIPPLAAYLGIPQDLASAVSTVVYAVLIGGAISEG